MRTRDRMVGAVLAAVIVIACSSTISTSNTSLVTISLGKGGSAILAARPLTLLTQFRRFLASLPLVSEAHAYIPSIMHRVRITVSAADLPPVAVTAETSLKVFAEITIEVPNGTARHFLVEGLDASGLVAFRGESTADLIGSEVTLDLALSYTGGGIYVAVIGKDAPGCGTALNPCGTIGFALSIALDNERIVVRPGTYDVAASPLQLKPGTQLMCTDPATTIITTTATGLPSDFALIYGSDGTSVDLCRLQPPAGVNGINDVLVGTPTGTKTIINSVSIFNAVGGIILSGDSTVIGSTVQSSSWGIQVLGGRPEIVSNDLFFNTVGIDIVNGEPNVRQNLVHDNNTGILIGLDAAGFPRLSDNSIYCNTFVDLQADSANIIDVRNNSWDHGQTTTPPGPTVMSGSCLAGADICFSAMRPQYEPFRPAVPNGCP